MDNDRVLQAWKLDSGSKLFVASLADAADAVAAVENVESSGGTNTLLDPPSQLGTSDTETLALLSQDIDNSKLLTEETSCRTAPQSDTARKSRAAPSRVNTKQNVNTVEIVKKDNRYSVVLDGVSQGVIERTENGSYPSNSAFWLPRFKETIIDKETRKERRVVQPVLLSMRVEDFETVPQSCRVDALQKVVNNASVYMDNERVKSFEIVPSIVGNSKGNALLLPYPVSCTPAPYVCINDYSRVLDLELTIKLHFLPQSDKLELKKNYDILQAGGRDFSIGSVLWTAVSAIRGITSLMISSTMFTAKVVAKTAKDVVTSGGAVAAATGTPVGLGGTAVLTGFYLVWNVISRTNANPDLMKLDDKQLETCKSALAAALERGPQINRLSLQELTTMIYRIAETRANGSVISKTEETSGMSIHDFEDMDWNTEAALLQWLVYGSGEREDKDPYTGLYTRTSNFKHAAKFVKKEIKNAPPTLNTVGVQGLDGLTLSTCRTEFTYSISIQEADGSMGPRIILNSTRINGMDAGWVGAGYNESFLECKRAIYCLRQRLSVLPGVSRWMATHGTFVSDTNNGTILVQGKDDTTRLLVGRELEDANGVKRDPKSLRERVDKAEKVFTQTEEKVKTLTETLEKLNALLNKEKAPTKIKELRDRIDAIRTQLDDTKLQKQVNFTTVQRTKQALAKPRKFANIFDYEETYRRLMQDVLGSYTLSESTTSDQLNSDSFGFWNQFGTGVPEQQIQLTHRIQSISSLAASLGVPEYLITSDSYRYKRFVEFLCPDVFPRRSKYMRFASFVVPSPLEQDERIGNTQPEVLRVIPHTLVFSKELVSTFGSVTIIQPKNLSDTTFVTASQSKLSYACVEQARAVLKNMSGEFPALLSNMEISKGNGLHFVQVYKIIDQKNASRVFSKPLGVDEIGLDYIGMSYIPHAEAAEHMYQFEKAGGAVLSQMMKIAGGSRPSGVARFLSSIGLPLNFYSLFALASFSEIAAFYILKHGSPLKNECGFEIKRIELVQSAASKALESARRIGSYLVDLKNSSSNEVQVIDYNDVIFYCIPGLSHLGVTLRRFGGLGNTMPRLDKHAYISVGNALLAIGRRNKMDLYSIPFTCMQSSLSKLPAAIQDLHNGNTAVEIQLISATLSYERVLVASASCTRSKGLVACVCADSVLSRPVVLKAFCYDQYTAGNSTRSVNNKTSQSSWHPTPMLSNKRLLLARMAQLRVDIYPEQKQQSASNSVLSEVLRDDYDKLSKMMTQLNVRDLAHNRESRPIANFMVPFGMTTTGTVMDIMHSKFETHPVWIDALELACSSVLVSDESMAKAYVLPSMSDENGRLLGPNMIKVFNGEVHVPLYSNTNNNLLTTIDDTMYSESLSVFANKSESNTEPLSKIAGILSDSYRRVMHNAERIFQVVTACASGVVLPDYKSEFLTMITPQEDTHTPVFLACICIGNAIANAETGSSHAIVVLDVGQKTQQARLAIQGMCRNLKKGGVKAMPFNELCACVSVL